MKSLKLSLVFVIAVVSIPWIYLLRIYPQLPSTVPIHFGVDGKPDGFGDKSTLFLGLSILSGLSFGLFFLLRNIHRIDPKKAAATGAAVFNKMALALVVFLSALNVVIISSAVHSSIDFGKLLMPLMGLFFAYMGNLMYSVKPNYFFGIRLPWTLENEDNWRKTHQLAGKVWFAGGLVIVLAVFLRGSDMHPFIFLGIIALMTLIPVVYSFLLFKKNKSNQPS